jgi:hypothetical protein
MAAALALIAAFLFALAAALQQKGSLNLPTRRERFVVHRLINDGDRQAVERAAGDIDRFAVASLPSLAPGQAALLGIDYPIPLIIQCPPEGPARLQWARLSEALASEKRC